MHALVTTLSLGICLIGVSVAGAVNARPFGAGYATPYGDYYRGGPYHRGMAPGRAMRGRPYRDYRYYPRRFHTRPYAYSHHPYMPAPAAMGYPAPMYPSATAQRPAPAGGYEPMAGLTGSAHPKVPAVAGSAIEASTVAEPRRLGPAQIVDSALGQVLADIQGMTLYTYAPDSDGRSNCQGSCLQNWPAYTASSDSQVEGDFNILNRQDAGSQWVYKGKPLYLWIGDRAPGDVTGNGVGGSWQVARP